MQCSRLGLSIMKPKPMGWIVRHYNKQKEDIVKIVSRCIHLHWGAAGLPHPDKLGSGKGEDAYFVEENAAGVFDGVGGWEAKGVDPSLYANELANKTAELVRIKGSCQIVDALEYAAQSTTFMGSSTATVVAYCEEKDSLIGLNLGDSGFLQVRKGSVLFRTTEQQHFFNCPFQLGTGSRNRVQDGEFIDLRIEVGDWLILGTDGLFDNMKTEEILELIGCYDENVDPPLLAHRLAQTAMEFSMDENKTSPFAENANEAGFIYLGGKRDDITVLVGKVVK
ncbi:phosphatase isoform 1 [Galdieria sulphuraria]|uniref:Protein phosphatase n=1 Tax=Galdieria sulphuraria TaxID=130081 RepID=M2VY69_GALSU|nr:phosphatase isoform 1 [Galdieria sulphuraria]EME28236.1 phosphatase isoform 1 [Galdieria sulphuraria]|eukprot:XP_005704756.1 phosphatase isoform 1 [Galdieria sulphuraria]